MRMQPGGTDSDQLKILQSPHGLMLKKDSKDETRRSMKKYVEENFTPEKVLAKEKESQLIKSSSTYQVYQTSLGDDIIVKIVSN